jgi:hypothetical protein
VDADQGGMPTTTLKSVEELRTALSKEAAFDTSPLVPGERW